MATTTANASPILKPEDVEALLVLPTLAASIAAQVCRVVRTSSPTMRFPRVVADATADWYDELEEITPSDPTLDEVEVTARKVAGLTILSNEAADDTSPEAAEVVGDSLARDLARKIDQAFFAGAPAPAPEGLAALTGFGDVAAPAAWANLDPFAAASAEAEQVGATVDAWVTSPAEALALGTLKASDGSNAPLLATDPALPSRRMVEGRPLYVSSFVAPGDVWGIDAARTVLVVRNEAEVESDRSVFFTRDGVAVRAKMRAAFAFTQAESVVRIRRATAA